MKLINLKCLKKNEGNDDESYTVGYLRIMYINKPKEEISICRDKTLYLEKFILLLNGKLNDIITKT